MSLIYLISGAGDPSEMRAQTNCKIFGGMSETANVGELSITPATDVVSCNRLVRDG